MPTDANGKHAVTARPKFLITIDTEGDNLWARPKTVETQNARFLPRFQALCETVGFKPTYLVDYDMARCEEFVEFGKDALGRGVAEIGMHLHPWNTPPEHRLTVDDDHHHPYLIEYPDSMVHEKVALMTNLLRDTFETPMRSHRAGRWAFNHVYADALVRNGYWVDCSVTPHISWAPYKGDPARSGGADYRAFPGRAYFVDPSDISREGKSGLLEVPMSIMPCRYQRINAIRQRWKTGSLVRRGLDRLFPPYTWFRPKRDNLRSMLAVLSWARQTRGGYIEFMLHSSEFMPGGSPTFASAADIEKLYDDLAALFEQAAKSFDGATLTQYYELHCGQQALIAANPWPPHPQPLSPGVPGARGVV